MILNNPNRLWIKLISGEIKVNLLKISQRAGWFLRSCREIVLFYSWEKSKRLRELLKNASDQNSYFNKEKILWIQLNTLKYCNKEQISRIIRSMTPWKSYILSISIFFISLFILLLLLLLESYFRPSTPNCLKHRGETCFQGVRDLRQEWVRVRKYKMWVSLTKLI